MVDDSSVYQIVDDFFVDWYRRSETSIPEHLQQALYELFLNVALDKPTDLLQYCFDYFTKLKTDKKITPFHVEKEELDSETKALLHQRRQSIYVHTVHPEEDVGSFSEKAVHPKPEKVRVQLSLALRNVFLFRHLDAKDINYIVNAMFIRDVKEGDIVINQGDVGDNFYLVEHGTFTAYVEKDGVRTNLCVYCGNGSFGELALLYNAPRAAFVEANTDGRLWAVDRNTFRRIVLKSAFEKRKLFSGILGKVRILSDLQTYDLMNIADAVLETVYTDGKWIFHEGDVADGMYFVIKGTVVIYKKDPESNQDIVLKHLGAGSYFGELALILLRPRAASARASGTVKLAFLESLAFARLIPPRCIKQMMTKFKDYQEELKNVFGQPVKFF